ncbi:TIGR03943 family putative permease subunit [Streptomyces regalis]|uniref:TIGR03943 family protein n=1 Tax=Streptomyces regalis TaxID=68262 RepID=A0A0X3ULQ6_9ACTN|nr:TIGR03943 family protein [Streptomyces regalis]KUL33523.1 hypothetical protein ADL12_21380 [Streptomyces regalis]
MRRYGPAAVLLLTGAAILRISLFSELYLRYVQAGLRPYLVVSGFLLVLLAVAAAVVGRPKQEPHAEQGRHTEHGEHDESGDDSHAHDQHGGHHSPRLAWLLTLPALALLLSPPPALGSYSADREAAQQAAQGVGAFPAPASGNPVELTLAEFSSRAIYDSGRSLAGRTVRLTGFVTRAGDGTWYVTRLLVAWVAVTGTWHPEGAPGTDEAWPPVLDAASVRRVAQPAKPYEKR